MPRVRRGFTGHRRHKKFLKMAKGMRGGRSRLYRTAREQVLRGLKIAYKERRRKKRQFRALWIVRINASARALGTTGCARRMWAWIARSWPRWR